MTKSIHIFDIGNVLIRWEPLKIAHTIKKTNPAFPLEIGEKIPNSKAWEDLDRGILSISQIVHLYSHKYTKEHIEEFLKQAFNSLMPIAEGWDLFYQAKKGGKKVYFLSNLGFEFRDFLLSKYADFSQADGAVFSCDVGCIKPETGIYQTLLSRYSIPAQAALFFDDKPENIEAAKQFGIDGCLIQHLDSCIT